MMLTRRAILASAVSLPLRAASLPEQSAALLLERVFPNRDLTYLLLDAASGQTIAARWAHPGDPIPTGSLVKPFTALAYDRPFPLFTCTGRNCWLPRGHGRMNIVSAIAHSCNAYFLELACGVNLERLGAVAAQYGLAAPPRDASPELLIGLGDAWRQSPQAIARAYCELVARSAVVLPGMALSARSGTGRGIGPGAYAKTGTAPCIDGSHDAGDGFAIAVYPIDTPRYALLARVHGTTGAKAAVVCGKMRSALGGR